MTSTATARLGVRPRFRDAPSVRSVREHRTALAVPRRSTAVRAKSASGEHAVDVPLPTSGALAPPPWVRDAVAQWPWRGGLEPCGEHAVTRLSQEHVTGVVPNDLVGSLYRVGPGRIRVGSTKYKHWFDGDGAVFKVQFNEDGTVDAGTKFVRTKRLETQELAERQQNNQDVGIAVRGAWTQASADFPLANFGKFPTNPSNTSPMFHAGKLMALCEGGAPVEIDEDTLATKGLVNFESKNKSETMPMGFSAHAKKDADGVLYTWGLASPPAIGMAVGKISESGKVLKVVDLPLCAASEQGGAVDYEFTMIHDCAMSEKHLVFIVPPWRLKPGFDMKLVKALAGAESFGHAFAWDAGKGAWLVVLRKDDLSVVVTREIKNMSTYHFAGAYDVLGDKSNGGNDSVRVLVNELNGERHDLEKRFGDMYLSEWAPDGYNTLCEYVVDLKTGSLVRDAPLVPRAETPGSQSRKNAAVAGQLPMEFPIVAPASFGRAPRFVYTLCFAGSGGGYFDAIQKLDVGAETHQVRFLQPGVFPSEVEFVPKRKSGGDEKEDSGYLLYLEYDSSEHKSAVVVLDAQDVAGPELCRVKLPYHVPYSFHGTYKHAEREGVK